MKRGAARTFVMVDAGFVDLVRPAMYGSYHEIEVVGKASAPQLSRWSSPARSAKAATSSPATTPSCSSRAICRVPPPATCWPSAMPALTATP